MGEDNSIRIIHSSDGFWFTLLLRVKRNILGILHLIKKNIVMSSACKLFHLKCGLLYTLSSVHRSNFFTDSAIINRQYFTQCSVDPRKRFNILQI